MDLNQLFAGLPPLLALILTAVISVIATWAKMKKPSPIEPSPVTPVSPVKPAPDTDPLAGWPGLPGHPVLRLVIPFLLRLIVPVTAANSAVQLFGSAESLDLEDEFGLNALAVAVKRDPAIAAKLVTLLGGSLSR